MELLDRVYKLIVQNRFGELGRILPKPEILYIRALLEEKFGKQYTPNQIKQLLEECLDYND